MNETIARIISAIHQLTSVSVPPLVIAIDGWSGAGKSTIAKLIQAELDAVVVPLGDFFSAHIPDTFWKKASVEEKLKKIQMGRYLRRSAETTQGQTQSKMVFI